MVASSATICASLPRSHLYLPGPHRGVRNREGLEGQSEVIVCDVLLNALTFWTADYCNVTSGYAVNGFTDELLAALKAWTASGCCSRRAWMRMSMPVR
jgi:hypothetical protein